MSEVDCSFRIYGLVQGVGFRPFVSELASKKGVSGYVRNDGGIVYARFIGDREAVESILDRLLALKKKNRYLPGAVVDRIEKIELTEQIEEGRFGFHIVESTGSDSDRLRILPPDIATCSECEKEVLDRSNRRFKHPFISCVSCGPRYTIMEEVPYDRERTVMSEFDLCPECASEYETDGDRRHFAQTVCCKNCGPVVKAYRRLRDTDDEETVERDEDVNGVICAATSDDAIKLATEVLKNKGIVAVKDIGGYHFACDVSSSSAVKRLRDFKHRDRKPFAVMMRDMTEIRRFCDVSTKEEELLSSDIRPIVLLNPLPDEFAPSISKDVLGASERVGAMLPCNPLQILLLEKISPLVMTSGNRGGEPICISDKVMKEYLVAGYIDLVLSHDRKILTGLDDSIIQVSHEMDLVQILRRARGYVPLPIDMGRSLKYDTLAAGGDLKSVFAYGRDSFAYLSGHFDDLEESRCADARGAEMQRLGRLLGISADRFVCDKHPAYISVNDTQNRAMAAGEGSLVKVQHHHAHILSVMAEYHLKEPVLGIAFDGTGYGDDGNIWGGEILLCEGTEYKRIGHLKEVRLIGGDAAAKNARQTSIMYSLACEKEGYSKGDTTIPGILRAAYASSTGAYHTSSVGRLFDAIAALLGIADENTYEAECAMKLQSAAETEKWYKPDPRFTDPDRYIIKENKVYIIDGVKIYSVISKRLEEGTKIGKLALAFHHILANVSAKVCGLYAKDMGYTPSDLPVALGGGTMQNLLFTELLTESLSKEGFRTYINQKVPSGDGGLALGQLYYAVLEHEGR